MSSTGKKLDPLSEAIRQAKAELRADLSEALRRGASAWAAQSNAVLQRHDQRIARLEQRGATTPKKG